TRFGPLTYIADPNPTPAEASRLWGRVPAPPRGRTSVRASEPFVMWKLGPWTRKRGTTTSSSNPTRTGRELAILLPQPRSFIERRARTHSISAERAAQIFW